MEEKQRLRDKYPLAFRSVSPPPSLSKWEELTDEEVLAMEIPGVNPNAPLSLQADQIDIQNCEKLREIDVNMAAIHSVLTFEILPQLKEYARATEPLREVAQFWIGMFQAACTPVNQPAAADTTASPSQSAQMSTPITSTASRSGSRSQSQDITSTISENQSFKEFREGAEGSGNLVTSTPIVPRSKEDGSKASKIESTFSSITESPHSRLKREMANLNLDASSIDISNSSIQPPQQPVVEAISFSSASSRPFNSSSRSLPKAVGKALPPRDLRSKVLENAAMGSFQKESSIFKDKPSMSDLSTDSSLSQLEVRPKPVSIFNRPVNANPKEAGPVFTRAQQQIFGPPTGPGAAAAMQRRMLEGLLKEAAVEKRAGLPAGSMSPARSPARFAATRHIQSSRDISRYLDEDTEPSREQSHEVDEYGNEIIGGSRYDWNEDDSLEDESEEEYFAPSVQPLNLNRQYQDVEDEESVDSTGWRSTRGRSATGDAGISGGGATETLFGVGRRAQDMHEFELQNGLVGSGSDSFAPETPLQVRRGDARY
ncbi:DASH complex subunit ask1 [Serendipita sp. 399]|nr:DASH complex subunit ask1 [Serendipita sp. 399]